MPFRKISDLPAGTAQGGELIPATQSGVTRRLAVGNSVGAVPFFGMDGLKGTGNRAFFSLGAYLHSQNGSGTWLRIATITVSNTYSGARLLFWVDRAGDDTWAPCIVTVYAWRGTEPLPPIPNVFLGVEAVAQPTSLPSVADAALVEISPGILELWISQPQNLVAHINVYVLGTSRVPVAIDSGTVSRYTAPPSPVSGGASVQWSTNTANRLWTGRIVGAGSGSNGAFIRFSNGTQIAQHTIPSSSFGSQSGNGTFTDPYQRSVTWTYPAAFSAAPVVQVTVESTASGIVVARATARSATSASIRVEYAASNAAFTANLLAIGRWY